MFNHLRPQVLISLSIFTLLAGCVSPQRLNAVSSATAFHPVSPEELKMTTEPRAPAAPAVILYREVYRDDSGHTAHEDDYFRIKILTEEGRKYADIEIPFDKETGNVVGVHARTIKPDGSSVEFDGKVFSKSIIKGRGIKYLAKTFTLPAVQPGCIIEYFYTLDLSEDYIVDSQWIVSHELFTEAAKFSLKPYTNSYVNYHLRWTWQNMPSGSPPVAQGADDIIRLQVTNVPAFQKEDLMPPERELQARVDFTYSLDDSDPDVNRFWAKVGKRMDGNLESFLGKPKSLAPAVASIVAPGDAPEVKLQKLYARVQQMRNTSYEVYKTAEEDKRAKAKPPRNVEEIWKRGYANGSELTWLYLALVRAAGFEAYGVMAPNRQRHFFDPRREQSSRLDSNLVVVKLNGQNIFCDPGSAFTRFGLLPWQETDVTGLQVEKNGPVWVATLIPTSAQARTERRAELKLSDAGDLEGKVSLTYTDLEAARLRLEERNGDETERKTFLEDMLKGYIPAASEVKLSNQPEWKNSALPLVAEFSLRVPGWASLAGRHVIVPVGLFGAREKHIFDHAGRVYPIYVEYPYAEADEITIEIPPGWQVSSLPRGWSDTGKPATYSLKVENNQGKLHVARTMTVDFIAMELKFYPWLRTYFQEIKTNDDHQIVLDPAAARAGN